MNSTKLELQKENCREKLLEYLNGEIFHLRHHDDYKTIVKSGRIQNSKAGGYRSSSSSESSFGGNRGYVCIFDLINKPKEIINPGLDLYDFTKPGWFKSIHEIITNTIYALYTQQRYLT